MRLEQLNAFSAEAATTEFLRCCGSSRWAQLMTQRRPFSSPTQMADTADHVWWSLGREDWLEAFAAHPRIGDTGRPVLDTRVGVGPHAGASGCGIPASPKKEGWSSHEQSGLNAASPVVRERLAQGNHEYEARFGYIFIVCAMGKSADEMLAMLEWRLVNQPEHELKIAAEEQRRITRLRLERLLT